MCLARHAPVCYTTDVSEQAGESRIVRCAKLGKDLVGLVYRPFKGELGERIYEQISAEAWSQWIEHSKMLVNEYRLDLTSEDAHKTLKEQCEAFLFGDGSQQAPPPDYVPAAGDTDADS